MTIIGERYTVERNLPPPETILPGTIKIEYDAVGPSEPWRAVSMKISSSSDGSPILIEYHIAPGKGVCEFHEFDDSGNTLRFEDYCSR